MSLERTHHVAVVVIGRNEGERLKRCLDSVDPKKHTVVYVDSGSTDGSPMHAEAVGAQVVHLDMSRPFTAARARNAGFAACNRHAPQYIQFVDGDCELRDGWLTSAVGMLDADPGLAIVTGRLRERSPDRSVYNFLCDLEWAQPTGDVAWCGGIFMIRASAFVAVNGFDETLIAGEEPDLCRRLRARGLRIRRTSCEMALHDAAMVRFGQWFTRARRGGHAQFDALLRQSGRETLVPVLRSLGWGVGHPVLLALCLAAGLMLHAWWMLPAAVLITLLVLQWARLTLRSPHRELSLSRRALAATFLMLCKYAESAGIIRAAAQRAAGRSSRIIEYKASEPAVQSGRST